MKSRRPHTAAGRGFTLLEVMLAITVFAIVVTALFATFNAGTKTYRKSQERLDVIQRSRFVFDGFGRDLRCIVYADESDYNQAIHNRLDQIEKERLLAEENDTLDEFYEKYWGEDENGIVKNPYDMGIMYDLSFSGGEHQIQFTTYQSQIGYIPAMPWGVARVTYKLDRDQLIREVSDVITPGKDFWGQDIPKAPPFVEEIATGVKDWSLTYGYFYAGQWMEAVDWNSKEKRYRIPPIEFDEEDPQDDPNFQAKMTLLDQLPDDALPAYVSISLTLKDPRREKKLYHFQSLYRLPTSQETFIPIQFGDEEVDYFGDDNLPANTEPVAQSEDHS